MSRKVLVQAKITLVVDFIDAWEDDGIIFDVEENSCLNTHSVGAAFQKQVDAHNAANTCWACDMQCEMKVLDLNYEP